jgi:hypothetical protein
LNLDEYWSTTTKNIWGLETGDADTKLRLKREEEGVGSVLVLGETKILITRSGIIKEKKAV